MVKQSALHVSYLEVLASPGVPPLPSSTSLSTQQWFRPWPPAESLHSESTDFVLLD